MGKKVTFPEDLSALTDDALSRLETDAVAEFDELTAKDNFGADDLARSTALADGIEAVRTEQTARVEAANELANQREALKARVKPAAEPEGEPVEDDGAADGGAPAEPALAAGAKTKVPVEDVLASGNKMNSRLTEAATLQRRNMATLPRMGEPVLVASADIRGFTQGAEISGMSGLIAAMQARAKTLPDGKGLHNFVPVAQLQRDFRYKTDIDAGHDEIVEILQAAGNAQALVAAGGWCSPSEISYDFFNIVCEDGMLDVPTVGIRRGGMRWPTSPSFGDLASSTGLWVWNETQDIAALTGTAQSGTKTCAHVPCASFNEARLDCDGLCITAGNLSTDAWPEQLSNYMKLVMAAHAHRVNARLILKLANLCNANAVSLGVTGQGVATPVLDAVELMAVDYRNKYAMCDDATLEAVFPGWLLAMFRADLAKRKGWDSPGSAFNITNAEIASWLTLRGISAQFVQDWQVRGLTALGASGATNIGAASPATAWPTQVSFMIYAAGTFVKGNGMTLDLGVIRDSTLNATNDYTAAWSEDCWLVANPGHEGRLVTVPLCANGAVASDTTYACPAL